MLILQRKAGQSLQIGDNVTITVVETGDGRVRLAIDAPREVTILRTELVEAMKANQAAAQEQASPAELLKLLEKGQ